MSLSISKSIKTFPKLPYQEIQEKILGKSYSLSLIFIGEKRACALNKTHRNATYIPNVLSFPLTHDTGEIYITPNVAQKEASKYEMTSTEYIGYLFIHGLLHLKGYPHGDTMEKLEKKYCRLFKLQ